MRITEAENFIASLQIASLSPKIYLSQSSDGRYRTISQRDQKNMNTERIALLAQECWNSLQTEKLSASQREEDVVRFAATLGSYLTRVDYSKPWWKRFASFLGLKTKAECQIEKLVRKSKRQLNTKRLTYLETIENQQDEFRTGAGLTEQFRLLFHKVLDSKGRRPNLDGLPFSESIKSLTRDLIQFNSMPEHRDPGVANLIEELFFAHYIQLAMERHELNEICLLPPGFFRWLDKMFGFPSLSYRGIAKQIAERMRHLPPEGDHNHAVLIPGGTRSHAILYSIEKESGGTYSLTIINRGAGAELMPKPRKKDACAEMMVTGLTEKELSIDFLTNLLMLKSKKNMDEVHQFIKDHLVKSAPSNVQYVSPHVLQHNGTCTMKCLLAMARDRQGTSLNKKFKVFMTVKAIGESLSFLVAFFTLGPIFALFELKKLRSDSQEVLKKRMAKVARLS